MKIIDVIIVGAGPAGLEAATVAAKRGHSVVLFEEKHEIGGQFNMAKQIPGKEECDVTEFSKINNYLKEKSPDVVINCAAFVGGISYGYKYPVEMLSKNSLMAMNIYKASYDNAVKKLINPISNCAYPAEFTTYKEEDILGGSDPYSASKSSTELISFLL